MARSTERAVADHEKREAMERAYRSPEYTGVQNGECCNSHRLPSMWPGLAAILGIF